MKDRMSERRRDRGRMKCRSRSIVPGVHLRCAVASAKAQNAVDTATHRLFVIVGTRSTWLLCDGSYFLCVSFIPFLPVARSTFLSVALVFRKTKRKYKCLSELFGENGCVLCQQLNCATHTRNRSKIWLIFTTCETLICRRR